MISDHKDGLYRELARQSEECDRRDGVDLTLRCAACGAVRSLHANPHLYPWSLYAEEDSGGRKRFVVENYLQSTVCPDCNAARTLTLVAQRGPLK